MLPRSANTPVCMDHSIVIGCLWVFVSAIVAFLPVRQQYVGLLIGLRGRTIHVPFDVPEPVASLFSTRAR